jgi:hypothetical protein
MLRKKQAIMAGIVIVALVSISSFAVSTAAAFQNEGPADGSLNEYFVYFPPYTILRPAHTYSMAHIVGDGKDPIDYEYLDYVYFDIIIRDDLTWTISIFPPFYCWAGGDITYYHFTFKVESNKRGLMYWYDSYDQNYPWCGTYEKQVYCCNSMPIWIGETITATLWYHVTGNVNSNGIPLYGTFDWSHTDTVSVTNFAITPQ